MPFRNVAFSDRRSVPQCGVLQTVCFPDELPNDQSRDSCTPPAQLRTIDHLNLSRWRCMVTFAGPSARPMDSNSERLKPASTEAQASCTLRADARTTSQIG